MKYTYKTQGTCSQLIEFDITDGIISDVKFAGGCNGNLQGVGRLVEGKNAKEISDLLAGIKCGYKSTSCPDQLSKAIKQALEG